MGAVPTHSPDRTRAVPGSPVTPPRLRSPLARAVVPVLGGAAVIGLIFLATWGIAVFISRGGAESTERLAPPTFELGSVERRAESIAEDGPLLFPGLNTTTGERTLVVDHTGDDAAAGWRVYWAYPADRAATCVVEQERGTSTFIDCEGRRLDVAELALPDGVFPVVSNERTLSIDLRAAVAED
jgi:hypothetical protein